jgi:hypothetical protein
MSTETKPNLQLEIGHVLFIDVVGYSKVLIDDQRELQQQLNRIVRGTEQFRAAEAVGKLVRLPAEVSNVLPRSNRGAALRIRRASRRLTAARSEYNKARRPAAAAPDKTFDHAPETTVDDLSWPKAMKAPEFMHRILLRNFVDTKRHICGTSARCFHR